MDDDDHRHLHHHDLPPFPSATGVPLSPRPPQNSPVPILPHPPLGFSPTTPQSYFFTNPPPPHEQPHFSPSFLSYGFPIGNEPINSLLPKDEGRRVLDAWSTKVARSKRRLARQRSLSLSKTSSSSSGFGGSSDEYSKGITITHYPNTNSQSNRNQNLFTLCTSDKILRMLLKKELKNSDVGSLGRIVLPKREAEENLPLLTDKEGMPIVIRDVNSTRKWAMKYKYWANNRSRMYVLESTGDFVKQNGLLMGDVITLYEDESKNFYVTIDKGEKHLSMEENCETRNHHSATAAYPNMGIKDEEEDASLALLIEQLKHKSEEDELPHPPCCCTSSNLVASQTTDSYFENGSNTQRPSSSMEKGNNNKNNNNNGKEVEDLQAINGFEDCFGDLDTLPEVSGFKFPLFDYLSNDRT